MGAEGSEGGALWTLVDTEAEAAGVWAEAETLTEGVPVEVLVETLVLVEAETDGVEGVETPGRPSACAGTA